MVVDHPAGTEVFTDERFAVPPVKLAITVVAPPHAIAKAVDDRGTDVTEIVSKLDGTYLDTFGRASTGAYFRDHFVEVDLGNDARRAGLYGLLPRDGCTPRTPP